MKFNWQEENWFSSFSEESLELSSICDDTRSLKPQDAFFAYDGTRYSAKDFCFEALYKKAAAVFLDIKYKEEIYKHKNFSSKLPIFFSDNFLEKAAMAMQKILDMPSQKISVIGVTGTNGKTTVANSIFQCYAPNSAFLGTIGKKINNKIQEEGSLTTPSAATVHNFLNQVYQNKVSVAAMECSSHGIVQGRVSGIAWNYLIFTNLSQDHLDFHQDMESYYQAKKKLFLNIDKSIPPKIIINTDDFYGKRLAKELKKEIAFAKIYSYGTNDYADFQIQEIKPDFNKYLFSLKFHSLNNSPSIKFSTSFLGKFNVYNLTSVIAAIFLEKENYSKENNLNLQELLKKISTLQPVNGRMQTIQKHCPVLIDYAHTPDALQKALQTIAEIKPKKIFCVFGCGGDRDIKKRPMMGRIAVELSQHVIVTNDNPRNEDPQKIAQDILRGISKNKNSCRVNVLLDRKEAIHYALEQADRDDIILVAGKGHEKYQILNTGRIFFSDQQVVENWQR